MIIIFIRTERSIKEFFSLYPIVSTLVIIHFILWIVLYLFPSNIGMSVWEWGVGHNLAIHQLGEYRRLLTPIFLHGDLTHTLFNSFALVIFGPALERMLGKYKFIIIYLLMGVLGNLGTYLVNPLSITPHLGASGAIYGLFGLYMFMIVLRKHLIDSNSASIVMVILALGFVMTFLRDNINIYAHVFGFISGFALGPIALHKVKPFYKR